MHIAFALLQIYRVLITEPQTVNGSRSMPTAEILTIDAVLYLFSIDRLAHQVE